MSKLQKILILILCFAIFFSLGNIIYAADKNEKGSRVTAFSYESNDNPSLGSLLKVQAVGLLFILKSQNL